VAAVLFPGIRAGASLKPRQAGCDTVPVPRLFPGIRAGASLKRLANIIWDADCQTRLFPGIRAGASLKRLALAAAPE